LQATLDIGPGTASTQPQYDYAVVVDEGNNPKSFKNSQEYISGFGGFISPVSL